MLDDEEQILRRERLRLTNEKLEEEVKKARLESKPQNWGTTFIKNIVPIGGFIAVLATLYGVYNSYNKTLLDRERARISETRALIAEAAQKITSDNSVYKVTGIGTLGSFLDRTNREFHQQILSTLAAAITSERDPQVQRAISDLIEEIPTKNVKETHGWAEEIRTRLWEGMGFTSQDQAGPISTSNWKYFLRTLVLVNRSFVQKADLWTKRKPRVDFPLDNSDEFIAWHLGQIISKIAKKNVINDYKDYSGIYCVECDFDSVLFPDEVNFSAAILDNASFSRATLRKAVFDDLSLFGTQFIETELVDSKFRSPGLWNSRRIKPLKYLANSLLAAYQINLEYPY